MRVATFSPHYNSPQNSTEKRDAQLAETEKFIQELRDSIDENYHVTLIDDCSNAKAKMALSSFQARYSTWNGSWMTLRFMPENRGVARRLYDGYRAAGNADIIVRLDSDREHDPSMIPSLVERIEAGADVALCQIEYAANHLSEEDRAFNQEEGALQGRLIIGEPLLHNCPGFAAYKKEALNDILPLYERYLETYAQAYGRECSWGGDIALLWLASKAGLSIDTSTVQPSRIPAPNRSEEKRQVQRIECALHLALLQKQHP